MVASDRQMLTLLATLKSSPFAAVFQVSDVPSTQNFSVSRRVSLMGRTLKLDSHRFELVVPWRAVERTLQNRVLIFAAMSAFVVTSCAVAEEEVTTQSHQLMGQELKTTFADHKLRPDSLRKGNQPDWRYFCADGRWAMFGGLVPKYGTYSIENESVCTSTDGNEPICFSATTDGVTLWVKANGDSQIPVEVELIPLKGTCY